MVSYGLKQAKRKLAPVDSPYSWDEGRPVPAHVDPSPDTRTCPACDGFAPDDCPECGGDGRVRGSDPSL